MNGCHDVAKMLAAIRCAFCHHAKSSVERCVYCGRFTCLDCHHGKNHVDACIGVRRELPRGRR